MSRITTAATASLSACGVVLAALVAYPGPATAVDPVRLEGSTVVRQEITYHKSKPSDVGTVLMTRFSFTPKCPTGGCDVVAKFHNGARNVRFKLSPVSDTRFSGYTTYPGDCYSTRTGAVIAEDAYRVTAKLVIDVTSYRWDGRALTFTGTRAGTFKPTSEAPQNCQRDGNRLSLSGSFG